MDQWWPWNLWCIFSLLLIVGVRGIEYMRDQGLQWYHIFCNQDCQIIHIVWFVHISLLLLQRKLQHQISMRQISTIGVATDQRCLRNLQYTSAFLLGVVSWGVVSMWDRWLQTISYLKFCNCRGRGLIFQECKPNIFESETDSTNANNHVTPDAKKISHWLSRSYIPVIALICTFSSVFDISYFSESMARIFSPWTGTQKIRYFWGQQISREYTPTRVHGLIPGKIIVYNYH